MMVVDLKVGGERRVFRKDSRLRVEGRLRNMRRDLVHVSLSHWFVELTFFVIRYMDDLSTLMSNEEAKKSSTSTDGDIRSHFNSHGFLPEANIPSITSTSSWV